MALPSIEKTWQFSLNNTVAASATHIRDALHAIKNQLIAFGLTVVGSSNSSAAGLDAVDRLSASSNWVWATGGSAHSWIVLGCSGVQSGMQLLIDCDAQGAGATAYYNARVLVSPSAGFTGGSASARPTATDEQSLPTVTTTAWCNPYSTANAIRWHVWVSSDFSCIRFAVCSNGVAGTMFLLDKLGDPETGVTNPWIALHVVGGASGTAAMTIANGSNSANVRGRPLTTNVAASLTCEGAGTQGAACALLTTASDFASSWPLSALKVLSTATGGRGPWGRVFDLWYGSTGRVSGDDYDQTGNKVLGQLGQFVLPSNGVVLATA